MQRGLRMPSSLSSAKPSRHFPSHLELYGQCPRRYRLKVLDRRQVQESFSPAIVKGNAAHTVLKDCLRRRATVGSDPDNLLALVERHLPSVGYSSESAWAHDVTEVLGWVNYGLSKVDPRATILGTERFLDRRHRASASGQPITLSVVVDVLLLREDGNGRPFFEVIDFKSGQRFDNSPYPPIFARFALRQMIKSHLPDDEFAKVLFSEVYLAKQSVRTVDLDLPTCLQRWDEVTNVVAAIENDTLWAPNPSPMCSWCPFNGDGCNPDAAEDSDNLW